MIRMKLTFETQEELTVLLDHIGRHRIKSLKQGKRGKYSSAWLEVYSPSELRIHAALGVACPTAK